MESILQNLFKHSDNFKKYQEVNSKLIIGDPHQKEKLVSIVIPTFRRPLKLKEALESALKQIDYYDYDIIIIDNDPERGCPTEKMMSDFKDQKIRYYKNEQNIGMVGNWNRGYELSKSEWIVMLHDDDLLCPEYLKTISKLFQTTIQIITISYYSWDMRLSDSFTPPVHNNKRRKVFKYKTYDFLFGFPVGAPLGMAAKRNFVKKIGGFDENFYPSFDYAFFAKASKYGAICKILNQNLGIYRYAVNETLNVSNLRQFVEVDYKIKLMILDELKLNIFKPFFTKIFNNYRAHYISNASASFNYSDQELLREFVTKKELEEPKPSFIKMLFRLMTFLRKIYYEIVYINFNSN